MMVINISRYRIGILIFVRILILVREIVKIVSGKRKNIKIKYKMVNYWYLVVVLFRNFVIVIGKCMKVSG